MRLKRNANEDMNVNERHITNDQLTTTKIQPNSKSPMPRPEVLLRLPQVLARFPVARSTWYAGIRTGIYPKPILISRRAVAWTQESIDRLIILQSGVQNI